MITEKSEEGRLGRVLRGVGGIYTVFLEGGGCISCRVRGSVRAPGVGETRTAGAYNTEARLDRVLCGDMVRVTAEDAARADAADGSGGVISEILPRRNALIRPPLANIDHIFAAVAAARPAPILPTLDKLISIAEYNSIEPVIIIGKCELDRERTAELADIYRSAGFRVFPLSCATGEGVGDVSAFIDSLPRGSVSAFAGASGVGKSTLMNALFPELSLRTAGVSEKIGRGRHTTRAAVLYPLSGGGYLADTPGFSLLDFESFDFFGLDDLPGTMREFKKYLGGCRYSDCTHTKEEDCAIVRAVKNGEISAARHASYLEMYSALRSKPFWGKGK